MKNRVLHQVKISGMLSKLFSLIIMKIPKISYVSNKGNLVENEEDRKELFNSFFGNAVKKIGFA